MSGTFEQAESGSPRRVIALAASAGGIQAISKVLADLPPDLPAAVLIVLHIPPHRPSLLHHIFQRKTRLKVRQAALGDPIREGVALVAPPDHHLVVGEGGRVCLPRTPKVQFTRPAADPLFESVAERYGPRAVLVILTGYGRNGAACLPAAKTLGAHILAQDEATSYQFSMPRTAIETGAVDETLPLDQIGPRLIELVLDPTPSVTKVGG